MPLLPALVRLFNEYAIDHVLYSLNSAESIRCGPRQFRSLYHIYAQLIDDTTGHTLLAVSSRDKEVRKVLKNGGNVAAAKTVGKVLAERAKGASIASVVFDRGGYAYHGRVKALAEAAREGGLQF